MVKKQFLKMAYGISIGFLFAGCANEELMDGSLPEGKYPLEIASVSVTGEVQTRVSENPTDGNSSAWDWNGTEQIGVQLYSDGTAAAYTLKSGNTISATANPLYWNSTATTTVYAAWYPYADGTIDLSKQNTNGLAYVMKGTGSGNYKNGVSLSFTHQLAKVRVALSAESTADMSGATVSVLNYANCTSAKGTVTATGTQTYIPMKASTYADGNTYYEANVVAGTTLETDAFQIVSNGKTVKCSISPVELKAGDMHVITLTMIKQINLSNGSDINITGNGTYTITGSGTKTININGSPTIYLDNAKVAVTSASTPAVNITGGSPTIYVKGTENSLSSSQYGGIIMSNNANLKITGGGREACKLTVTAGSGASRNDYSLDKPELMSFVGIGAATKCTCGNITIDNVQLTVAGGHFSDNRGGAAAIGTSGPVSNSTTQCGDITINAAQINATSGAGAAAIGTSDTGGAYMAEQTNAHLACGKIKIVNSSLSITVKPVSEEHNYYGAGIGTGYLCDVKYGCADTHIGDIVIDCQPLKEEAFTEDFKKLGVNEGNAGYKIGCGFHNCEGGVNCTDHTIGGLYYYYDSSQIAFSPAGYPGTWELRE